MNELATLEKPQYPWYQLGQLPTLEQGDFIPICPVILPENHYEILSSLSQGKAVEAQMVGNYVDLIIMSQSCDLENNKINQILLCGYYSALKLSKNDLSEIKKRKKTFTSSFGEM